MDQQQTPAPLDWNPEEFHRQKTSPPASIPTWAKESFLTQETESYNNPSLLSHAWLIKKEQCFLQVKISSLRWYVVRGTWGCWQTVCQVAHANLLCISDQDAQNKVHACRRVGPCWKHRESHLCVWYYSLPQVLGCACLTSWYSGFS